MKSQPQLNLVSKVKRTYKLKTGLGILSLLFSMLFLFPNAANAQISWERYTGSVPANAVIGGSENGKSLYVACGMHNGSYHPGKLVNTHCNIGWGGKEIVIRDFQVMVNPAKSNLRWQAISGTRLPAHSVFAGREPNGTAYYVGRAKKSNGTVHPGKVFLVNGTYICNYGWGGKEVTEKQNFEILTAQPVSARKQNIKVRPAPPRVREKQEIVTQSSSSTSNEPVLVTSLEQLYQGGTFKIVNAHDNRALCTLHNAQDPQNKGNQEPLILFDYYGNLSQKWSINPLGSGLFSLKNKHGGRALCTLHNSKDPSHKGNQEPAIQFNYYGDLTQKWNLAYLGEGNWSIKNSFDGKALCTLHNAQDPAHKGNQEPTIVFNYYGNASQKWLIYRIGN